MKVRVVTEELYPWFDPDHAKSTFSDYWTTEIDMTVEEYAEWLVVNAQWESWQRKFKERYEAAKYQVGQGV